MILNGGHFAQMLSLYAAGATRKYPLGSGECWKRAKAAKKALKHLPLKYVEGKLYHPELMGADGSGPHGFCIIEADEGVVVVDPMVGELLINGGGDPMEFIWEY